MAALRAARRASDCGRSSLTAACFRRVAADTTWPIWLVLSR